MPYKLVYIISSKIAEKDLSLSVDKIESMIKEFGGNILEKRELEKKDFCYLIKREKSGYYGDFYFELSPENFVEFEKKLKNLSEILRWQIFKIRTDKGKKEKKERKKEQYKKDEPTEEEKNNIFKKIDTLDI